MFGPEHRLRAMYAFDLIEQMTYTNAGAPDWSVSPRVWHDRKVAEWTLRSYRMSLRMQRFTLGASASTALQPVR